MFKKLDGLKLGHNFRQYKVIPMKNDGNLIEVVHSYGQPSLFQSMLKLQLSDKHEYDI